MRAAGHAAGARIKKMTVDSACAYEPMKVPRVVVEDDALLATMPSGLLTGMGHDVCAIADTVARALPHGLEPEGEQLTANSGEARLSQSGVKHFHTSRKASGCNRCRTVTTAKSGSSASRGASPPTEPFGQQKFLLPPQLGLRAFCALLSASVIDR